MSGLIYALSAGTGAISDAKTRAGLRRMVGPGLLVAVGYIDPGNWATDIAGGSGFGYGLLSIVFLSAMMALGFQVLVSRVALASGEDLARLTAKHLPSSLAKAAWLAGEAAILATALAELIGGAIAFRLLFSIPLMAGVAMTAAGTLAVLIVARNKAERHESIVALLLAVVAAAFVYLLLKSNPVWMDVAGGIARSGAALRDPNGFMIALGILGATLMPHNLYLHSGSLAKHARDIPAASRGIAMRLARNDTVVCLTIAMLINAAILVVAGASLTAGGASLSSLTDAHAVIGQTLGAGAAIVFAIALYAAGQSSTITGVLAGRVLSAGFHTGHWSDRKRALITRVVAGVAAIGLLAIGGGQNPDALLVFSQVILSLALPFALVPLVMLAMRRDVMGRHVLGTPAAMLAIVATLFVIGLDGYLVIGAVK
jgi:manganese transport protein